MTKFLELREKGEKTSFRAHTQAARKFADVLRSPESGNAMAKFANVPLMDSAPSNVPGGACLAWSVGLVLIFSSWKFWHLVATQSQRFMKTSVHAGLQA